MTKEIVHSLILIFSIAFSFLFAKTGLKNYDVQFAAILFIILFLAKKYLLPKNSPSRLLESVIFTLIILTTVNTTGGADSPFFFLIYFLLFSLSLLLEPVVSMTISLALIVFFLLFIPESQNLKTLLPIFSLAFLTPFALFMGQEYTKIQKLRIRTKILEENLTQTKEDAFLFLSLMLKNHLKNIKMSAENFMGDHELDKIKKNIAKMEKLIDQYEKSS